MSTPSQESFVSGHPAHQFHFARPTTAWATTGAVLGAAAVLAPAVVLILLTEQSMVLLGVAALGAFFGGAGFGAMLGAVLATIRASAEEHEASLLRVPVSSRARG